MQHIGTRCLPLGCRRPCRAAATALALAVWMLPAVARGQEWTRFRGPNGTGESETTIPGTWTAADYNWRVELPGRGHSSPVLWGERIFLTSAEPQGRRAWLLCLNAADGQPLWKKEFDVEDYRIHGQNSFATSTPAVDEKRVYVAWAGPEKNRLLAFDHEGTELWTAELGPFVSEHGFGTSPIVYGDLVVINDDQDGTSTLVARDRANGEPRWRTPRRTAVTAYSTPCVYRPANQPDQLIFNSKAHGISSIDPLTGKLNWELDVFDKRSISSPLVVGDLIFGSCGSGQGGNYLVAVRPGPQPELAYKVDKSAPYVPTSVARGNLLFLWGDSGIVTCIDAPSGKIEWQKRIGGNFSGSPVRAGDKIVCVSAEGEAVVLAARNQFELLGRQSVGELCRSTPAIAGGRLYLRTESHLISLGGQTAVKSER